MMTQQDILTLAKAGFTAQQIAALNAVQPAAPEPPAETAEAATNNAPVQSIDQIMGAINGLSQQIQASNLQHAQQPASQQTTDSILAAIINPPELDPDRNKTGGV